ncbi:MAG TPA: hypothetical protein VF746_03755 [Longimicrobium sp.]|jgi:hypothetical protein
MVKQRHCPFTQAPPSNPRAMHPSLQRAWLQARAEDPPAGAATACAAPNASAAAMPAGTSLRDINVRCMGSVTPSGLEGDARAGADQVM